MYIRSGHPRAFAHNPPNPTRFSRTRRPSFFHYAAHQIHNETLLPKDKQRQLPVAREKFAPSTFRDVDGCELQKKLGVPLLFDVYAKLECGESTAAFLKLYKFAKEGKLKCYDTFTD